MADEPNTTTEKPKRLIDRIGVPEIIDITLVSGLFVIILMWVFFNPKENQILIALATAWASMTATIVNFHRGSSAGSKEAQQTVKEVALKQEPKP